MQVLYKHVRGGGGLTRNAYFAYVVRGWVWGQRENAYVKDQNSYPLENVF